MRLGLVFVVIGIVLSLGVPRLLRGPVYSRVQVDPATGQISFNFDTRDMQRSQWKKPETFAAGVNLPALIVVAPAQLAIWRDGPIPFQYRVLWLVWSSTLVGVFFWYFAGRFFEQLWLMFKGRPFDAPKTPDWIFALICAGVGGLGASAWFSGSDLPDLLAFAVGGTYWALIGISALMVRTMQFRGIRKALRAERAESVQMFHKEVLTEEPKTDKLVDR